MEYFDTILLNVNGNKKFQTENKKCTLFVNVIKMLNTSESSTSNAN